MPIQARLQIDTPRRHMTWSLDVPDARMLGHLLYVQRELTDQVLDYYDTYPSDGTG